jgi:hypothetical protein
VSVATLIRAERVDGKIGMMPANEAAVRAALERAGVEFTADGGVRPRKPAGG